MKLGGGARACGAAQFRLLMVRADRESKKQNQRGCTRD